MALKSLPLNRPLSKKGFSLTELVVALGVSGILIMGMATTAQMASDSAASIRNFKAVSDLQSSLAETLAFRPSCTAAMAGLDFDLAAAQSPAGQEIALNVPSLNTPGGVIQAGVDLPEYGVRVSSLRLTDAQDYGALPNEGPFYGTVRIALERNSRLPGARALPEKIVGGVYLEMDGAGNFQGCASVASSERDFQELCTNFGGIFDPPTQTCLLPGPEFGCDTGEYLVGASDGTADCLPLGDGGLCANGTYLTELGLGRSVCSQKPDVVITTLPRPLGNAVVNNPPPAGEEPSDPPTQTSTGGTWGCVSGAEVGSLCGGLRGRTCPRVGEMHPDPYACTRDGPPGQFGDHNIVRDPIQCICMDATTCAAAGARCSN